MFCHRKRKKSINYFFLKALLTLIIYQTLISLPKRQGLHLNAIEEKHRREIKPSKKSAKEAKTEK